MNNLQTKLNIELTNYLSDYFESSKFKIIWSMNVLEEINPEEDQLTGKIQININGINKTKFPFVINEQQSIDLGGPVSKLAPTNDFLFYCLADVTTHQYIQLQTEIDESFKQITVKPLNNPFSNNNGSNFTVEPTAFESGGKAYREPLMRFNVIEKTVQSAFSEYIEKEFALEDFTISLPKENIFINPQDEKNIALLVEQIHDGISISNNIKSVILNLKDQEIAKKPNELDQPHLKQIANILSQGCIELGEQISSRVLFNKVNKIRSPQIKRLLGLSANAYFEPIDELLSMFENHLITYESSLNMSNLKNLQSDHQEYCDKLISLLNRLEKALIDLSNAYDSAIS